MGTNGRRPSDSKGALEESLSPRAYARRRRHCIRFREGIRAAGSRQITVAAQRRIHTGLPPRHPYIDVRAPKVVLVYREKKRRNLVDLPDSTARHTTGSCQGPRSRPPSSASLDIHQQVALRSSIEGSHRREQHWPCRHAKPKHRQTYPQHPDRARPSPTVQKP